MTKPVLAVNFRKSLLMSVGILLRIFSRTEERKSILGRLSGSSFFVIRPQVPKNFLKVTECFPFGSWKAMTGPLCSMKLSCAHALRYIQIFIFLCASARPYLKFPKVEYVCVFFLSL